MVQLSEAVGERQGAAVPGGQWQCNTSPRAGKNNRLRRVDTCTHTRARVIQTHLKLVYHYFGLLQLLQTVTVPPLVRLDRLSLSGQHFKIKLNELEIGRRRRVRLAPQLPLEPRFP